MKLRGWCALIGFACANPAAPPPLPGDVINATVLVFVAESTTATLSVQLDNRESVTTSRDSVCLRFVTYGESVTLNLYLSANGTQQSGEFPWAPTIEEPNIGFVAQADANGLVHVYYGTPQAAC